MSPIVWRPPTRLLMADADPVQPGGDRAGWISGSLRGAIGGARSGSGLVAGAVTIVNGAITAVGAPTNGGAGYPTNARFEVVITGDGAGALVVANTNSAGAVSSFSAVSGGARYTVATVGVRVASIRYIYFDCGPSWGQYQIAAAVASDLDGGYVGSMEFSCSMDAVGEYVPTVTATLATESHFPGLEYSGYPGRAVRLSARYLKLRCFVARTIGPAARVSLTLYAA